VAQSAGSRRFAHCSQCSPLGVVSAGEGLHVRRSGAVRQSIDADELRRRHHRLRRAFTPSASRVSNGASLPQANAAGAIYSSAVLAFGGVLFGTTSGYLYALG
jgi:hypothetical protein